MRAGTTGYFIGHAAPLTGLLLFRHAGFLSHTAAIAQLGYFRQHTTGLFQTAHNWVISSCWVRISHGGHSTTGLFHASTQLGYFVMLGSSLARAGAIAQLGYFMSAHNWVISCSTQLGYFVMLGSSLARWQ